MTEALNFQIPLNLYYRGAFGKKSRNESIKTWNDNMEQITTNPVDNSLHLFQILNMIPTFEEVHDGFSYFFFRDGVKPDWDQHLDWFSMETVFEVSDFFASTQKDKWQDIKAQCEACIYNLLLIWCGNSYEATRSLQGITVKIRRARVTISCWYSDEKNGESILKLLKHMFDMIESAEVSSDGKDKSIRKYFTQSLKDQQEESSRKSSKASSRAGSRNHSNRERSDRRDKSESNSRPQRQFNRNPVQQSNGPPQ